VALIHFVVASFVILSGKSFFEPSKRNLSTDFFCAFIQNFQAVFDYEPCSLLRKIIHLFRADPKEGPPAELAETFEPGLFSLKEAKAGSLLLGQKLLQGDGVAVRIAKVPLRLAIGCWFKHALGYCRIQRAESNAPVHGEMRKA
jgi:hypothetical protein